MSFAKGLVNILMRGIGRNAGTPKTPPFIPSGISINPRMSDLPSDGDPRVMARPTGNGTYAERVVGDGGRIEGFGDERDHQPLATVPLSPRPASSTPIAEPASEYERLVNMGRRLSAEKNIDESGNVIKQPGRFKAGVMNALNGIGSLARRNLEAGRTDWSDLAGVVGIGAGGAVAGAAKPDIFVKARHEEAVAKNKQAQAEEMDRMTGLAKIKDIQADTQSKAAYAYINSPEFTKAKDDAKKSIDEAKSFNEAVKELDSIAQKGAEPEYLQQRANEIESRFGKKVIIPRYSPKAEGGFTLPPGGIRYDSKGNPLVQNTNPTPGQLDADFKNQEEIRQFDSTKKQYEQSLGDAKQVVAQRESEVKDLDNNKPKWDQSQANNNTGDEEADKKANAYIKKYNDGLQDWQRRRDKAQENWAEAINQQKGWEQKITGLGEGPSRRAAPTTAKTFVPQKDGKYHYTMADIQAAAQQSGKSVELILSQLRSNPQVVIEE